MIENNKTEHYDNDVQLGDSEKQPQLDLEFSHVERVTPVKAPVQENISVLAKLQGILLPFVRRKSDVDNENSGEKTTMSWNKPESWSVLKPLPEKHRRLFAVLFLLILILLLILWLKPSTTSQDYQSFQSQQNGQSLPIEFQPLDGQTITSNPQLTPLENSDSTLSLQQKGSVVENALSIINYKDTESQASTLNQNNEANKTESNNTQVASSKQSKAATTQKQVKTTVSNKSASVIKNAPPRPSIARPPVAEAKPVISSSNNTNSKTLIIPQGISLMQVFRNNNLNISDVNAMTKAPGAEGVLSRFKAGDKVNIEVNAQGRVTRLTLKNGHYFVRNSDGSYTYKR